MASKMNNGPEPDKATHKYEQKVRKNVHIVNREFGQVCIFAFSNKIPYFNLKRQITSNKQPATSNKPHVSRFPLRHQASPLFQLA
jgi:hypothetical protein